MKSSKKFSEKASEIILERTTIPFAVLSVIGFVDASYLTVKHYLGSTINCSIFSGCEEVLNSQYSVVAGVPIAVVGSLYYLTLFLLTVAYLDTKRKFLLRITAYIVAAGFVASLAFVLLQIFVIKALCLYCLISAAITATLFVLSLIYWKALASFSEKAV